MYLGLAVRKKRLGLAVYDGFLALLLFGLGISDLKDLDKSDLTNCSVYSGERFYQVIKNNTPLMVLIEAKLIIENSKT